MSTKEQSHLMIDLYIGKKLHASRPLSLTSVIPDILSVPFLFLRVS